MAAITQTISANGDTFICYARPATGSESYIASAHIYGTFGGGTVTLGCSSDGGVTITSFGPGYVASTNDVFSLPPLGYSTNNTKNMGIYATVSGASSPSITVDMFDNS